MEGEAICVCVLIDNQHALIGIHGHCWKYRDERQCRARDACTGGVCNEKMNGVSMKEEEERVKRGGGKRRRRRIWRRAERP